MSSRKSANGLSPQDQIGKYRLSKKLGEGGSGEVWKALDTIEGIWVALKIPRLRLDGTSDQSSIRKEIRLVASLRHRNILPVKNADFIDGRIVLATELSVGTLEDRSRPMSTPRILAIMRQVLQALAYAHTNRVVHCDVSPGNIFLFPDGRAALGDFGISRQYAPNMATMEEFGTPGYVAPEQAYGKPELASDCFSTALIIHEFVTGVLPRWPFEWPVRGADRLQNRTNWAFTRMIRKALELSPRNRYRNADEMLDTMMAAVPALRSGERASRVSKKPVVDWRKARREAFLGKYGKLLNPEFRCVSCGEPVSEIMDACPWCGETRNSFEHASAFPDYCQDCYKGLLPEWRYCPWCYGPGFTRYEERRRPDKRYKAKCRHCRGKLMPFMSYCPWCRRKIGRAWQVHPFPDRCRHCRHSVDETFWTFCPWCKASLVS